VDLFNQILDIEKYPIQFKRGVTITLFKGGKKDRLDPNSYRDITLTSVLQKLFENVLFLRIKQINTEINFPHPLQQGFRPGCGSLPAGFLITETVYDYMERDSDIYVAFLDNQKAFNNVWHSGLLYKLYKLGINGRGWHLLSDSFRESSTRILYEGQLSRNSQYTKESGKEGSYHRGSFY
jgi:hypothetical protein